MAKHLERNFYCVHINTISSFTPENIFLDHTIYLPVISSKASVIFGNLTGAIQLSLPKTRCVFLFLENGSSKRHLYVIQ